MNLFNVCYKWKFLTENGIHNEIGDQYLTEGAVYFRRGGIVLQDATGAPLGTTIWGRPSDYPPLPAVPSSVHVLSPTESEALTGQVFLH